MLGTKIGPLTNLSEDVTLAARDALVCLDGVSTGVAYKLVEALADGWRTLDPSLVRDAQGPRPAPAVLVPLHPGQSSSTGSTADPWTPLGPRCQWSQRPRPVGRELRIASQDLTLMQAHSHLRPTSRRRSKLDIH